MTLKVNFCDFWPGFEENNLFFQILEKNFQISIVEDPDYLFYSVYGNKHLAYHNCIKILYTGENLIPDFNLCDYALGFHYMNFGDRYLRFPLFAYYQWYYKEFSIIELFNNSKIKILEEDLNKRKFCNFIYSNNVNSDPLRDKFFHELCKYKKVDSGGRHLNNLNMAVEHKLEFIKEYKFTIAFENSSVPGYTTEKLIEPILMRSLPIYYGNPLVHLDFKTEAFLRVKDIGDFNRVIEEIITLDKNDSLYLEKLNMAKFNVDNNLYDWEKKFLFFMNNIFSQPLSSAKRRVNYGFAKYHFEELNLQAELLEIRRRKNNFKAKVKTILKKFQKI